MVTFQSEEQLLPTPGENGKSCPYQTPRIAGSSLPLSVNLEPQQRPLPPELSALPYQRAEPFPALHQLHQGRQLLLERLRTPTLVSIFI